MTIEVISISLWGHQTNKQKCKFKIGDIVRISKYKRKVFDWGYTLKWTEEILLLTMC